MTQPAGSQQIVQERPRSDLAVVRLNRPQSLNALTLEMVFHLHRILDQLNEDSEIRCIILTGNGRAFCAGMDLQGSANKETTGNNIAGRVELQTTFSTMITKMRATKKPVIAAVNGAAAGSGMALALGADIRLASETARFLIAAIKLGISSGECGISYHLPRLIGASRAFEIMLTGRAISADEADRIGLVSGVCPGEELEGHALELAESILRNSPYGVGETKKLMWQNLDAPSLESAISLENQTQIIASLTEDHTEAVKAFSEKREAKFTGN